MPADGAVGAGGPPNANSTAEAKFVSLRKARSQSLLTAIEKNTVLDSSCEQQIQNFGKKQLQLETELFDIRKQKAAQGSKQVVAPTTPKSILPEAPKSEEEEESVEPKSDLLKRRASLTSSLMDIFGGGANKASPSAKATAADDASAVAAAAAAGSQLPAASPAAFPKPRPRRSVSLSSDVSPYAAGKGPGASAVTTDTSTMTVWVNGLPRQVPRRMSVPNQHAVLAQVAGISGAEQRRKLTFGPKASSSAHGSKSSLLADTPGNNSPDITLPALQGRSNDRS